jgi:glutamate racemase
MKKIGFIDSGIGGLSILNTLIESHYQAEFYYISDGDNVPYGNKSQSFMFERTQLMVESLTKLGVEVIVLACNTLTAQTIDRLRRETTIQFIGVEPYINFLNKAPTKNSCGLILTQATYKSNRFKQLLSKYDPDQRIKVIPLPKLAIIIEQLKNKSFDLIKDEISQELEVVRSFNLGYLILGCTHYPIVSNYIESYLGLKTINPHLSVIERIADICRLKKTSKVQDKFHYKSNLSDQWSEESITSLNFLNL